MIERHQKAPAIGVIPSTAQVIFDIDSIKELILQHWKERFQGTNCRPLKKDDIIIELGGNDLFRFVVQVKE